MHFYICVQYFPLLFTGSVFTYSIIQLSIFWLGHVSIIFVKTEFPFYSKAIENSRIVHLIVVILAVLLPCIPVIAAVSTGGYLTAIYPQPVCFTKNPDAAYYSFALILCFICAIGGPLLIITFWNAFKVPRMHVYFYLSISSNF